MKIKRDVCRLLVSLVFIILSAVMPAVPAFAAEGESTAFRTVKVGIYQYPGYAEQDENGVWIGYDVEMVEKIAQNADLEVTFVPVDSYDAGTAKLADGSIDLLCDMSKTPEREADFLFGEYEQGNTGMSVVVRKDNDTVDYGNTEQLSRLTCAVQIENTTAVHYEEWCEEHGFEPKYRRFETNAGVFAALDNGEVDAAVIADDTAVSGKYLIVLSFYKIPYFYVFAKGNSELKNRMDSSADKVFTQNPLYEETLKQKYGLVSYSSMALTADEKAYVASHPDITVAVVENDDPYYKTGEDGKPKGILPDLYKKVSEITGFSVHFQAFDTQQLAVDSVLAGKTDALGLYSDGIPYAHHAGMRLTTGYSNVSLVMLSRNGTDAESIKKIAVKKRSENAVQSSLLQQISNASFVECGSAGDCFNALQTGKADALVVALPSATWLTNQTNSSAYSFTPLAGAGIELTAAVKYDNSMLADILSNGILQSQDLFNGIVANNTGSENALQVFVSRIPAGMIIAFDIVMIFMVLFLIWAVFSVAKSRKIKIAAVRAEAEADEQRVKAEAMEKSAEEKNAFFSNISHDMRTPLNGILGYADLAAKQDSLEKAKSYIAKIKLSGNLLLSLINDTLTISKIGNGKLELKPEPVETDALTAEITDSILSLAARKNIDFIVDDTGLRRRSVFADKLNVEKIILNLLSNAVKFTPPGGHVHLTVRDDPQNAEDPDILVTVRDDGIGMSEDYLRHMYEPFSQEKRHGYDSVGTGLGLSIVKQLVDLMGGTIKAESRVGEGTIFTVRLHLKRALQDTASEKTDAVQESTVALKGKKILLCEDNMMNREIAVALLKDKEMTVVSAENGKIGTELFFESAPGEFAAILMDLRMPIMDGYEAAKAIRAGNRQDAKTIPIYAMTADAFSEDVQKCLDAGMNGHIAKPIDPQRLYRLLGKSVKNGCV